jgi:hypothetical protein
VSERERAHPCSKLQQNFYHYTKMEPSLQPFIILLITTRDVSKVYSVGCCHNILMTSYRATETSTIAWTISDHFLYTSFPNFTIFGQILKILLASLIVHFQKQNACLSTHLLYYLSCKQKECVLWSWTWQSSLYPLIKQPEADMSWPGIEPRSPKS